MLFSPNLNVDNNDSLNKALLIHWTHFIHVMRSVQASYMKVFLFKMAVKGHSYQTFAWWMLIGNLLFDLLQTTLTILDNMIGIYKKSIYSEFS